MKSSQVKQYTVRNMPPELDRTLRKRAKEDGKSLNEAVIEVLRRGVGLTDEIPLHHDLDSLIGTWVEDPEIEKALEAQDRVDPDLWS